MFLRYCQQKNAYLNKNYFFPIPARTWLLPARSARTPAPTSSAPRQPPSTPAWQPPPRRLATGASGPGPPCPGTSCGTGPASR